MKIRFFPMVLAIAVLSLAVGSLAFPGDTSSRPDAAAAKEPEKPVKRSGRPEAITYDDLKTEIPPDAKWEDKYATERVKELDGKTVRITGVMLSDFQSKGIEKFVMLKNVECKFGEGGEAHHCIFVHLAPGESTRYTTRPVTVEGVLLLKPWEGFDGNTWALYELRDAVVK